MSQARARTRSARSGVERTNHEATIVDETRQIPNRNFHGDALVPIPRLFFRKVGSRRSKPKGLELVTISKWNAYFTFGNSVWEFWSTFQEIPFSRENFRSGRQNQSFHLHSIRNFRIFWVNGKLPSCKPHKNS